MLLAFAAGGVLMSRLAFTGLVKVCTSLAMAASAQQRWWLVPFAQNHSCARLLVEVLVKACLHQQITRS